MSWSDRHIHEQTRSPLLTHTSWRGIVQPVSSNRDARQPLPPLQPAFPVKWHMPRNPFDIPEDQRASIIALCECGSRRELNAEFCRLGGDLSRSLRRWNALLQDNSEPARPHRSRSPSIYLAPYEGHEGNQHKCLPLWSLRLWSSVPSQ